MSLADVVTVNISSATATPTQPGFGTPLFLTYHILHPGSLVEEYANLAAVAADGHEVTSNAYLMASAAFAQNPAPTKIKIGKRSDAYTQTFTLKMGTPVVGEVFTVSINGTTCAYTALNTSATDVATALELLTEAVTGITSSSSTDTVTCTFGTAGATCVVKDWSNNITYTETTADTGSAIASDLVAIAAEDNDWYGFSIDTVSAVALVACATYAESNEKLFASHTNDSGAAAGIGTTLSGSARARSYIQYQGSNNTAYAGPAILGNRLPYTPGSDTWVFKTLSGIPVDTAQTLSASRQTAMLNANVSVYVTLAGLNVTQGGVSPAGEFIDIVRGRDWVKSTMQVRTFGYLANQATKVPYTDLGTDALASAGVRSVLGEAVRNGFFAASPAPTVTVTPVADIDASVRATRVYGGISWQATLAGAIHAVTITGNIGV
jgi:hypothetical protein